MLAGGGVVVKQNAQIIVDAFTVWQGRNLLKNKSALSAVTEPAIILSNASKTELQSAIEALTMILNQYNVSADQSRRIINTLGVGSKEGAGEIPYLTMGFEKAGTVASMANLSIETLTATLETLAPRIRELQIAGRGLKGTLRALQQGQMIRILNLQHWKTYAKKILLLPNCIESLAARTLPLHPSC